MSIVARVFVVLNLILSVAFLIFAMQIWTAKTKWQKMYEAERLANVSVKEKAQAKEIDLAKAVVQRDEVLKARKQEVVTLRTNVNGLRDDILALKTELGEAKANAQMGMALNEELMRKVTRGLEERDKAKNVVIKLQDAITVARTNETKARNERAEMENELNQLRQNYAQVRRDLMSVQEDLAQQTQRIMYALAHNVPPELLMGTDPVATQAALPPARVLAVKPDVNLVMLSIGSNAGAKPGYQMTISRGDTYIATAQIVKVYPDMCSATLKLKKGEVQANDEALSPVPGVR